MLKYDQENTACKNKKVTLLVGHGRRLGLQDVRSKLTFNPLL